MLNILKMTETLAERYLRQRKVIDCIINECNGSSRELYEAIPRFAHVLEKYCRQFEPECGKIVDKINQGRNLAAAFAGLEYGPKIIFFLNDALMHGFGEDQKNTLILARDSLTYDAENFLRQLSRVYRFMDYSEKNHQTISSSLERVSNSIESPEIKAACMIVGASVSNGLSLHYSMARNPEVFSVRDCSIVKRHELRGNLQIAFSQLAELTKFEASNV